MGNLLKGINEAMTNLAKIGESISQLADFINTDEGKKSIKSLVKELKKAKCPAWALLVNESPAALKVIATALKGEE